MDTPHGLESYWVEPGLLLAGEYPGSWDRAATGSRLGALLDLGIRVFVDLTEPEEFRPYALPLEEEATARGVEAASVRIPIVDMSVPSAGEMRQILDVITRAVAEGLPVYVHCLGGIGRTGTVVGCWLTERGLAGADVFETLAGLRTEAGLRRRASPETAKQVAFVRAWSGATAT